MRDLTALIGTCAGHGPNIGIYAERLLDDPLPWTRMRSVYRLLGLVRRYGPDPVETACSRSLDLDLDVVSVTKIANMLAKATEDHQPVLPAAAGTPGGRFARDPGEYTGAGGVQLTLIPGGQAATTTREETTDEHHHPGGQRHSVRADRPGRRRPDPHPESPQARADDPDPARTPRPGPATQDGPRRVPGAHPR
ncbi:hypothetical protein [Ornithinimicrobium cryptoxanthini]|uniref:Transposase n=1 Tax=Ornithinimicrobium cryptoxanthini TaxID=2934161 RepID=A0ABY4YMJ4_9MICO|nr:hypothetical protein [Ornithinimicrobium cryptoxanthini]USQ77715.1 hypothetical protein NF557_07405 [Ornithinimicrobium cryptoxanthini]